MSKALCVLLLCLLSILFVAPNFAVASDVSWVRVVEEGVNLYANCENSKVIFQLEKSYYLQVLGEESGMYLVAVMQNSELFPQITGYVWKSEVEDCDEPPIAPYYPSERITVGSDSAQLKLSPTPSAETIITVTNTQKMSYYGEITSYGEKWYYVYFCGKFGYVLASAVTKPVIALHPTPLSKPVVVPPTDPTDPPPSDEPTNNKGSVTEIFLIIFVAVLAVGISLALFLPGNIKKRDVFDSDI